MGKYKYGKVGICEAAKELKMSPQCLRQSMINNTLPIQIGVVAKSSSGLHNSYHIYRKPLNELKKLWGIK